MILPTAPTYRPFSFEHDTFTFANELIWQYHFDPETEAMRISRCDPPPKYTHRCFVMVRSARQFYLHARFEADRAMPEEAVYRQLIREVVARSPRKPCSDEEKIVIPGYDCLRAFSEARTTLLQAELGGRWQSYFVRSHWRMVAPMTRRQQEEMAAQLTEAVCLRPAPVVHLYRFPQLTINHGIILFAVTPTERDIQFDAYDPNIPDRPVKLFYDRAARTFNFPCAKYWPGGALNVFEKYIGGLY